MSEGIDINMELKVAVKDPSNSQGWTWVTIREAKVKRYYIRDIGKGSALVISYEFEDGSGGIGSGGIVIDLSKVTSVSKHSTGILIEVPVVSIILKEKGALKKLNGLKCQLVLHGNIATEIGRSIGIKIT
ncbi:MAG: hypothetical protein QXL15_00535 [Candidatus Korarchaeota archaeon]